MRVHKRRSIFLQVKGPRDIGENRGGAVRTPKGIMGPTVALHTHRGRGGSQRRGRGVRLGAVRAPDGTVKTITQMMVNKVPLIMRIPNGTIKTGTTVPII